MRIVNIGATIEVGINVTDAMINEGIVQFGDETEREDFDTDDEYRQQIAILIGREKLHAMIDAHPMFVTNEMDIEWVEYETEGN